MGPWVRLRVGRGPPCSLNASRGLEHGLLDERVAGKQILRTASLLGDGMNAVLTSCQTQSKLRKKQGLHGCSSQRASSALHFHIWSRVT